jgi:hypothetical protein
LLQGFKNKETYDGSWDSISGVSEGALNAYILSLYSSKNKSNIDQTI